MEIKIQPAGYIYFTPPSLTFFHPLHPLLDITWNVAAGVALKVGCYSLLLWGWAVFTALLFPAVHPPSLSLKASCYKFPPSALQVYTVVTVRSVYRIEYFLKFKLNTHHFAPNCYPNSKILLFNVAFQDGLEPVFILLTANFEFRAL